MIERHSREEGNIFEAGEEICARGLDLFSWWRGAGHRSVYNGYVVKGLNGQHGVKHWPLVQRTSVYCPPRPNNSFRSAARLSPLLSSSMRELQSSLPVQMMTCSA